MKKKIIRDIIYKYNNNKTEFYKKLNNKNTLKTYTKTIMDVDEIKKYFKKFNTFEVLDVMFDDYFNIFNILILENLKKDDRFIVNNLNNTFLYLYYLNNRNSVFKDSINIYKLLDFYINIITFNFDDYLDNPIFTNLIVSKKLIETLFKDIELLLSNNNLEIVINTENINKIKNSIKSDKYTEFGIPSINPYIILLTDANLYDDIYLTNENKLNLIRTCDEIKLLKFNLLLFMRNKFSNFNNFNNKNNKLINPLFIDIFYKFIFSLDDTYELFIDYVFKKIELDYKTLCYIYKEHKKHIKKVKKDNLEYNKLSDLKNVNVYSERIPISKYIDTSFNTLNTLKNTNLASFKYFYDFVELIGFLISVQRTNYIYINLYFDDLKDNLYKEKYIENNTLDKKYILHIDKILTNFYEEPYNLFDSNFYLSIYLEKIIKKIIKKNNIHISKKDTLNICINKLFENTNNDIVFYDKEDLIKLYKSTLTNNHTTPLNIRNSFGHLSNLSETFNSRLCSDILIFLYYMLPK